jgi:hypothetical protein
MGKGGGWIRRNMIGEKLPGSQLRVQRGSTASKSYMQKTFREQSFALPNHFLSFSASCLLLQQPSDLDYTIESEVTEVS